MQDSATKVGIIGCGNISGMYLKNAQQVFDILDVAACADLDADRARAKAKEFNVPRACSTEQLLADPEIEIVINLTTPDAHAPVALAAIEAGKSVYNEKPLAATREDGRRLLEAARDRGVLIGGAPGPILPRSQWNLRDSMMFRCLPQKIRSGE